ncbi:hypothetical protein [Hyphobacterium sp.]|uniref:hypothetical protein n=1 Tax=Hyphobacterium sp. TaxID=2004662 RepID=UPI003BAC5964
MMTVSLTPQQDGLPPDHTAEFVMEMLNELAALSDRAGLAQSSALISAAIPLVELENRSDYRRPSE